MRQISICVSTTEVYHLLARNLSLIYVLVWIPGVKFCGCRRPSYRTQASIQGVHSLVRLWSWPHMTTAHRGAASSKTLTAEMLKTRRRPVMYLQGGCQWVGMPGWGSYSILKIRATSFLHNVGTRRSYRKKNLSNHCVNVLHFCNLRRLLCDVCEATIEHEPFNQTLPAFC